MPPLGLAYIAAVLEKEGFHAEIFDMPALKADAGALSTYLDSKGFDIFGLSCNIFNLRIAIDMAKLIKAKNKRSIVVIGGRCNALPAENIFRHGQDIDIIVNGEGEKTMLDLCKYLVKNRNLNGVSGICGISYRDNGRIIKTQQAPFVDLDNLPLPARHLLPLKHYKMHPPFGVYPPLTIMETSRGCIYNCNFCGLSSPVRERSVANMISEINELKDKYGIREIHFVDPNFTYNQDRIEKFCVQLIQDKIKIHWTCKTRVDLISEGLLKLMTKSGCYMISYGVESGRQEVLNILNKGISIDNTCKAFEWTHKAGIRSLAYAIVGYPGESESDIQETKNLIKKIKPDFVLYNEFFLIPGSPLANQYFLENKLDYKNLIEFFFTEGSSDISRMRFSNHLKEANKSFYFSPSYILERVLKAKNLQDLINMAKGLIYLMLDKIRRKRIF